MQRRQFITMLGGAAATWPLTARAQSERVRQVVVWLARADDAEGQRHVTAFRQGLQALGWTDGHNIHTDYRWVSGDSDRRQTIAKEIVAQRPDVIVAESTVGVAALARESLTIPLVFINVSDPIGSGFVASLARPGGTITGFTANEPTLGSKWPELLKEIVPGVRRMAFMFNPDTAPYAAAFLQ
jgi:putative ABC transport system substrate-binding protein